LPALSDKLADGRSFRILTVVDQFTRECIYLEGDRAMTGMQVAQVLESDSSSDSSFFANLPLRSATTEYHCSYRRFGRFARTPSENQAVMITPSFYFADHELLRNQRPKNDETVRSRLAQQKSPVVMFVAFMGTAPSCCFSHVPELLRTHNSPADECNAGPSCPA